MGLIAAAVAVFVIFVFNKQKAEAGGPVPGDPEFVGPVQPADIAAQVNANKTAGLSIAGAVGGAVTGTLASLGYLTTAGPIGAAVAGAIAIIVLLRGTTHLVANDFVQKIQNPFGSYLATIVDDNDARMRAGQQTVAGAAQARDAVSILWSEFKAAGEAFAQRDPAHRTVFNQALAELDGPTPANNPPFFMTLVIAYINRDISDLQTGAIPRAR